LKHEKNGMEYFEIRVGGIYQTDIVTYDHYVVNILKLSLFKKSVLILRIVRNQ
jgi:hypothetical protein